jgi:Chlorophyll A-B binding protein
VLIACCSVATVGSTSAFVHVTKSQSRPLLASTVSDEPVDLVEIKRSSPAKRGPVPSRSIPFLTCNPVLDGELAGDFGFDPLNFAKNKEALWEFREAEVKHARLAMLVRTDERHYWYQ